MLGLFRDIFKNALHMLTYYIGDYFKMKDVVEKQEY